MRGTCFWQNIRKQDAPWLALDEYARDAEAAITFKEFRALAWEAANEKARSLGWVKSCAELHEEVKRASSMAVIRRQLYRHWRIEMSAAQFA